MERTNQLLFIEMYLQSRRTCGTIADYILAFLIVLECNSFYYNINEKSFLLLSISFLAFLVLYRLFRWSRNVMGLFPMFFLLFFVGSLVPLLKSGEYMVGFLFRVLFLSLLLLYFMSINIKRSSYYVLFFCFSEIVCCLSALSLFFWLGGEILAVIPSSGVVYTDWSQNFVANFYWLHFAAQGERNCGIFVEAPMFCIVLSTALCIELFLRSKYNKFRLILLIATILSTGCTTGYLIVMLVVFTRFFLYDNDRITLSHLILSIFGIVVAIAFYFISEDLLLKKMETDSYAVRIGYMVNAFNVWIESPLFGIGPYKNVEGASNSIMVLLADGGVYLFLFYLFGLLLVPIYAGIKCGNKAYMYFSILFFIPFTVTLILYNFLTLTLIALGLSLFFTQKMSKL